MEDFDNFAPSVLLVVPIIINYYGKLDRYCTFRRAHARGIFLLKRENMSSAIDSGLPLYHIRRYQLEFVFRTKLCKRMGQKSDRQKVAMRPNGWLGKIILPTKGQIMSTSFYLGTILIQSPPPANVTPDFQKGKKKEIHFRNA
jgi:hypothetical protein